jgi:pilus assembly protein Flp/PilA
MDKFINAARQFIQDEEAVTAIEYGLIAALIAVVIIVAVRSVGVNLSTVFNSIATELAPVAAPPPAAP